mgnify:CR=1 FL=1
MGVDLTGIIGHSLSKEEILALPEQIDQWEEVHHFFKSYNGDSYSQAEWDGYMDEEQLELIWRYFETSDSDHALTSKLKNFDSVIDCTFGTLAVYRKTILITHWNHKYSNLRNPDTAKSILTLNRLIARRFNQEEIIYCADSGYPTQSIEHTALFGADFAEIKTHAFSQFGTPPVEIEEARKYMFFIDRTDTELEEMTLWEGESPYWRYDSEAGDYELINNPYTKE